MNTFVYKGPVLKFNQIINNNWIAITQASTPCKALNNLKFRVKKELGLSVNSNITLDIKYLKLSKEVKK